MKERESLGNVSSESVFEALRHLSRAQEPLGVAEFHRALNEPTSSIYRALATLEAAGFAARYRGSPKFIPGAFCHHLVRALARRYPLRQTAEPYLARIADLSGGAATLNVRLGFYGIRIASMEGKADYFEGRRIGEARLLHEPAAPVVMLVFADPSVRRDYVRFLSVHHPADALRVDVAGLDAMASAAARIGYWATPDRDHSGRSWTGFPVRDGAGTVVASITTSLADAALAEDGRTGVLAEIRSTLDALQREILADPARAAMPYAHLPPDSIVIKAAAPSRP